MGNFASGIAPFVVHVDNTFALFELHKYDGWSTELKQIYDSHPKLKVMFTGSSILDIMAGEAVFCL